MRVHIDATAICNNRCRFCKAQDPNRRVHVRAAGDIRNELLEARARGIEFAVFSGGEVTIRPDFLHIIRMASDLGFTRIQVQTNARYFASRRNCELSLEAGVTEVAVSVHGCDSTMHDWHTRRRGSYRQTLSALQNLVQTGLVVLTNTVVTKHNCMHLTDVVQLMVDVGAATIQLAYIHLTGEAANHIKELVVRKRDAAPYICQALDVEVPPSVTKMVEAFPYCFLPNHESFSADLYATTAYLRQRGEFKPYDKSVVRAKGPRCKECNLERICRGPWREYPSMFGWEEFEPVSNVTIEELLNSKYVNAQF